jgi:hypothetical protein
VRTISGVESLERVARFLPLIGSSDREILVHEPDEDYYRNR